MKDSFDDIRPYCNAEISAAMQRIVHSEYFPRIAQFVFPDRSQAEVRSLIAGIDNVRDFQLKVMYYFNEQVIRRSTQGFSCSGAEQLSPDKSYLFVSNHRDIVLDASLLQNVLADNGLETCEITFGANLMSHPLVIDIGKSNKMFKVDRSGITQRMFYEKSVHLSRYIRWAVCDFHSSVWIAQRNGRTKDGNDATDHGLIKMFSLSGGKDVIESLVSLHITPIAVSYEWESCDLLKAQELLASRGHKYVKRPGEDINSIITGIMQPKGHVHFEICPPLCRKEFDSVKELGPNEQIGFAARLIDQRINRAYRLMPTNYVAYDIMNGTNRFADKYTTDVRHQFEERMERIVDAEMRKIFLGIYANPVLKKIEAHLE